jgi:DNA topoisomerase-2
MSSTLTALPQTAPSTNSKKKKNKQSTLVTASKDKEEEEEGSKRPKKSTRVVVSSSPLHQPSSSSSSSASAASAYVKLDQREHVLKRPDSYVGSVQVVRTSMWVYTPPPQQQPLASGAPTTALQDAQHCGKANTEKEKEEGEEGGGGGGGGGGSKSSNVVVFDQLKKTAKAPKPNSGLLEQREIAYVPALLKIFDEILVNALDNKSRDPEGTTWIKVWIDQEEGKITVANNGRGIPVCMHEKEKVLVPELIFGSLLTSDNYDDDKKKVTGGRNGYGAKLCNIFSTKFVVETADAETQSKFVQTFTANMTERTKPKVVAWTNKEPFTKITFWPDLKRFGMSKLDDDIVALFQKRVFDVAGCTDESVAVHLNGPRLPIKSFKQYSKMCAKSLGLKFGSPRSVEHVKVNDRWEVALCASDGQFEQVSFVNGIWTCKGGTHVDHVVNQITKHLFQVVEAKNKKNSAISQASIKQFLCVFVRAIIENPSFDSQTKDTLTSQAKTFGSAAKLSDVFLKSAASKKIGVVDQILALSAFKSRKIGKEGVKARKVFGIAKLDDANKAGTAQAHACTLILTEGDSAKTLAVSGLSVVGRDYFGVFPLKGKPLNVREARHDQIAKNEEIQSVVRIMGLKRDVEYTEQTVKTSLRYGHLMIMADQDHDGSHIKGLVVNMLHWYNESLLRVPGFLSEFITPIVKATPTLVLLSNNSGSSSSSQKQQLRLQKTKKSSKGNKVGQVTQQVFYTVPQYEQWKAARGSSIGKWRCKYYKGLGTSTAAEAKEYFSDLGKHRIPFKWTDGDERWINLAFSKQAANARKKWIDSVTCDTVVDYTTGAMTYGDFFNKEFVLFSQASVVRAIPSLVDGFKPSQRKVLFACFKRNLKHEIKVAQLAGYVSEHAQYHHGEASLMSTIVGMAQTFVGSNNVNLLFPSGQFGTRLMGGEDAASARYICTKLAAVTRSIFCCEDDDVLEQQEEDGVRIEPKYYAPIIPMALVNGCTGIATGWSTAVPKFNPLDVIDNIRRRLDGHAFQPMHPWYAGFTGVVEQVVCSSSSSSSSSGRPAKQRRIKQENEATQPDATQPEETQPETTPTKKTTSNAPAAPAAHLTQTAGESGLSEEDGLNHQATTTATSTCRQFRVLGHATAVEENKILITELPLGVWTTNYKDFLESLATAAAPTSLTSRSSNSNKQQACNNSASSSCATTPDSSAQEGGAGKKTSVKMPALVKDVQVNSTDTKVSFLVTLAPGVTFGDNPMLNEQFVKTFKLATTLSESNMVLVDARGAVRKYASVEEIMEQYFVERLSLYGKRKDRLCALISAEHTKMSNQARFISEFVNGTLEISRRSEAQVVKDLVARNYSPLFSSSTKPTAAATTAEAEDEATTSQADVQDDKTSSSSSTKPAAACLSAADGFSYLLDMNLRSLTLERFNALTLRVEQKAEALRKLKATTPAQLWINDLDVLEKLLRDQPADAGDGNDDNGGYTNSVSTQANSKNTKKTKQQHKNKKFVTDEKPRPLADYTRVAGDDAQVAQVVGAQRSSVNTKSSSSSSLSLLSNNTAAFVPPAVQKPVKRKQATLNKK